MLELNSKYNYKHIIFHQKFVASSTLSLKFLLCLKSVLLLKNNLVTNVRNKTITLISITVTELLFNVNLVG